MNSVQISIVIPMYNVEKYIGRCLESCLKQDICEELYEIIVVNDGSTDNSLEILKRYAEGDDRFIIIDKENGGYGIGMNVGIERATGEYIGIVEPDDYVPLNMYEDLYNLADRYNTDIIKSAWFMYYSADKNAVKDFQMCDFNTWQVINITDYPWLLTKQFSVWSAIYKREFLVKNHIRFQNDLSIIHMTL